MERVSSHVIVLVYGVLVLLSLSPESVFSPVDVGWEVSLERGGEGG